MKELATIFALLYVLSSGPTHPLACTLHRETVREGGREVIEDTLLVSPWWRTVYAPLIWESSQPSGLWLVWYWNLFPIQDA
jgi:hypothetical protein